MKVRNAMHAGVNCRTPETSVNEIARTMRTLDIGAVPITENGAVVGMVTDRDIVCRAIADGRDIAALTAADVMTQGVVCCTMDDDLQDAIHLMETRQVRRLPVLDDEGRLAGMLSLGDLSHAVKHELSGELTEAVSAHH